MQPEQTAFDFASGVSLLWRASAADADERQVHRLEHALSALLGKSVALTLTDNARTMLSARERDGIAHVRLHHMFVDADASTVQAVAGFLKGGRGGASGHLRRFIHDHSARIRPVVQTSAVCEPGIRGGIGRSASSLPADWRHKAAPVPAADACPELSPLRGRQSRHHDLERIMRELNALYFESAVRAHIGWARMARGQGRRRKRRSIKLGSYSGRGPVIRVHPVLDAAWVPHFFVEYIVYHEMLHDVIAMPVHNGRRRLHGSDFMQRERQFLRYADAIAWERANLERLLSS